MSHSTKQRASFAPLSAVLATLVLACAESSDLAGSHFILQSAEGFQPVAGSSVHLIFQASKLSLSAGCNSFAGDYRVEGGRLIVDSLASTNRGCAPALIAQDQQLGAFLSTRPRLTRSGDQLALSAESGMTLRFLDREVADPDRPLVDTVWLVDTLIDEHSFGTSPASTSALVQFARDGSVRVQGTCGGAAGRYTLHGDRLTLSNVSYSEQGCEPAAASVEPRVKAVLQAGTLTFAIEARRLTLTRDSIGLSAQAQEAQAGALLPDASVAQAGGP